MIRRHFWSALGGVCADGSAPQIADLCLTLQADERARSLLDAYKEQAIRSLQDLDNPNPVFPASRRWQDFQRHRKLKVKQGIRGAE